MFVSEPNTEEVITILRGLKDRYEVHHGVRIADSALVTAAVMANRYLTERRMPDKAVDLIDEAASSLRLQQESRPDVVQDLDRVMVMRRMEIEGLKRESDDASRARRAALETEVGALRVQLDELNERWKRERAALAEGKRLKESLEARRAELTSAQRTAQYARAGELMYSIIPGVCACARVRA